MTTQASSKGGGWGEAETRKPTQSSGEFMNYWKSTTQSSQQDMSTPVTTPPTDPPGECTPQHTSSSHHSTSQMNSNLSSSTLTPHLDPMKELFLEALLCQQKRPSPTPNAFAEHEPMPTPTNKQRKPSKCPRLIELLHSSTTSTGSQNLPNEPLPTLKPSPLRSLDCPVGNRIAEWKPESPRNVLDANGYPTNLAEDDLARIRAVLKEAYAPSTRKTYGSGLYLFHMYCDHRDIEEHHRAPIDQTVLSSFISSMVGVIRNSVYGIRAWHVIHSLQWSTNPNEVEALFTAGQKMAPKESKKKEKTPWSVEYLADICKALNTEDPKDATVLACITTVFWGTARLGEVTVPNLDGFNPQIHVKVSDVRRDERDRNNNEQTSFFLPWTKAAREKGETIFWAKQDGVVDPKSALEKHL